MGQAAAALVTEERDSDYLAVFDLIDGNCLYRTLCRWRRHDTLVVDDVPPEGHSLDDLGIHMVAEALLVPSAHLGLACLRDLIRVVCKDCILCVEAEKALQVPAVVGGQLSVDDRLRRSVLT